MHLDSLETYRFRNLRDGRVHFDAGVNLVCGPNGQGKTNLIEAVYCACLSKSFRTNHLDECAAFGSREFVARCTVAGRSLPDVAETRYTAAGKTLLLNGKEADVADIVGRAPVLCVTAEHHLVVAGGPEHRRKFFDGLLVLFQPRYLHALSQYRRALRQKTAALRQDDLTDGELDVWNRALLHAAREVVARRTSFAAQFAQRMGPDRFSGAPLQLQYAPSLPLELLQATGEAEKHMRERTRRERESGRCLCGPHLDRYELSLDDHAARKFASSGQKRSVLFDLYLTALDLLRESLGHYPAVLVDDADMELDPRRILTLVDTLSGKGQIFLTSAKSGLFEKALASCRKFSVREGVVESA